MDVKKWLSEIDDQIARLTAARNLLASQSEPAADDNKKHTPRKHRIPPETRRKMSLRMKRQWRAVKKAGRSTLA